MIYLFDTLGLYVNPLTGYPLAVSGTANSIGFRQAAVGITFTTDEFTFFEESTSAFSGSSTTRIIFGHRANGPNLSHAVNRSGTTYTGELRFRAREVSIAAGITRLGIFDTWLAPEYMEYTQRLWGAYSSGGQTGSIEFSLDVGLANATTFKTINCICNLL